MTSLQPSALTYLKAYDCISGKLHDLIALSAKNTERPTRYVELYADSGGETHFKAATIELSEADYRPPAPLMFVSHAYATNALQFIRLPKGWDGENIHPPHQQFLLCLEGQREVTASDGERRTFGPGCGVADARHDRQGPPLPRQGSAGLGGSRDSADLSGWLGGRPACTQATGADAAAAARPINATGMRALPSGRACETPWRLDRSQ
jgi:hypothetical protein